MSRVDENLKGKFQAIVDRNYAGQAKWFLNGFWETDGKEAETIWGFVAKAEEIDHRKKKEGNELDEFEAHRFLEQLGETLTVQAMRNKLRDIDIDFNKRMALIEYLMFRYNKSVKQVANAPQGGGSQSKIDEAQAKVAEANAAFDDMTARLNEEKKAEAENKQALQELTEQQMAFANKKAELQRKKDDPNVGTVSRGRASNELDQLLASDPLPLQRAKINQEATVRKCERSRKAAEEAEAKARALLDQAVAMLDELMKTGGVAYGDVWWMNRELTEKKKYLPKSRQ